MGYRNFSALVIFAQVILLVDFSSGSAKNFSGINPYLVNAAPGGFGKTSPADGATGVATLPSLSWQASNGATGYELCYDTTDDGSCARWISTGTSTSWALPDLSQNTTYYWQVRAIKESETSLDFDKFFDNFEDGSIGVSRWDEGVISGFVQDHAVAVVETGGSLVITPQINMTGSHFNGLKSERSYNFTDNSVIVEVLEAAQNGASTALIIGSDGMNKIVMEVRSGSLRLELYINGNKVGEKVLAYQSASHRWWRIRHESSDNTIQFDTSPDGIDWTQEYSLPRGSLTITAMKIHLMSGTAIPVAAPGQAVFDHINWHPLIPNESDWSSPIEVLSANPTNGTWDHILWGAASPSTMIKFNGTYFMYYTGAQGETGPPEFDPIRRSLGVATSPDGINFTKYSGNPVITYTTTGGTNIEEGVGGAAAIVVGGVIHMYYGAIRNTGGGNVDLDIRYRKSTDGYTFTNDTLIYSSPGDEYSVLGAVFDGTEWSVYIKGPMNAGNGAISRLSGLSPTSLSTKTSVTPVGFNAGGNADFIDGENFVLHLDRRNPNEDQFQVRVININEPDKISKPLFNFTFVAYDADTCPTTFRDTETGKWFMYTQEPANQRFVLRTYELNNPKLQEEITYANGSVSEFWSFTTDDETLNKVYLPQISKNP